VKASDLIDALSAAATAADVDLDEIDVRLAHQPQWAFEYAIDEHADITVVQVLRNEGLDPDRPPANVIYLPESHQIGYLPAEGARAIGWRSE
jgi:hypothetical protein